MDESPIKTGIKYKKSLGQNFIFDRNLLDAIVADAGVTATDTVIEVGAGAGTLTARLAAVAARVISVEIDQSLMPYLAKNLENCDNVQLVFDDILKLSHADIIGLINGSKKPSNDTKTAPADTNAGFKVVANLPYYITTPIIFHFLESDLAIKSMTFTVQKEVALRMTASPATPDYGALTLALAARANAKYMRTVSRNMFSPAPNVDSAVVRLDIVRPYDKFLSKVIKSIFAMRRKTLVNNLMSAFSLPRLEATAAVENAGISPNARAEQLSLDDVTALAAALNKSGIKS